MLKVDDPVLKRAAHHPHLEVLVIRASRNGSIRTTLRMGQDVPVAGLKGLKPPDGHIDVLLGEMQEVPVFILSRQRLLLQS